MVRMTNGVLSIRKGTEIRKIKKRIGSGLESSLRHFDVTVGPHCVDEWFPSSSENSKHSTRKARNELERKRDNIVAKRRALDVLQISKIREVANTLYTESRSILSISRERLATLDANDLLELPAIVTDFHSFAGGGRVVFKLKLEDVYVAAAIQEEFWQKYDFKILYFDHDGVQEQETEIELSNVYFFQKQQVRGIKEKILK